jgi:hypothetical protein
VHQKAPPEVSFSIMPPASKTLHLGILFAGVLASGASVPSATAAEGAAWRLSLSLGASHSFASTLTLEQEGFERIRTLARWNSRSFEMPPYYGARVSRWSGRHAWSVAFIHDKLYLDNPPPKVQQFSISHGLNLLTVEHGWRFGEWLLWCGGGVVLAHPENTVRNLSLPGDESGMLGGGYNVTGPTIGLALGRRFIVSRGLAIVGEARATASRVEVPIARGRASMNTSAVHALLGAEVSF